VPVAGIAFGVHPILGVDSRHHGIAHSAPSKPVSKLWEYIHVDGYTPMLHQGGSGDKLAVVKRNPEIDRGQKLRQ
jgi:hypothetical protein